MLLCFGAVIAVSCAVRGTAGVTALRLAGVWLGNCIHGDRNQVAFKRSATPILVVTGAPLLLR